MPDTKALQGFYPGIKANTEEMIPAGSLHHLYVASYGNPDGIPVLALHGGPGSGTAPYFARYFDPAVYHIFLADQRGAGKSVPKGEMRENTTAHLIDDIEVIRQHFGIKQWALFGGSWGSTLALLYAEAHPDRVLGLILRGIFLARKEDITVFVRDENSPVAMMRGAEWRAFKADISQLIAQAGYTDRISVAKDAMYHIIYVLLQHDDPAIQIAAAGKMAAWEKFNSYREKKPAELLKEADPDAVNMGWTEATYFEHGCFITHNQILNEIGKLKGLRIYINQGDLDFVCPPYMADELEAALRQMDPEGRYIVRNNCFAGHSQLEEPLIDALIRSSRDLVQWLQHE